MVNAGADSKISHIFALISGFESSQKVVTNV